MKRYKTVMVVAFVLCMTMISPNVARAFDSRDYNPAPPGTNLLLWYYQMVNGVQYYSDNKRIGDVDLHANIGILRMVHYGKLPGTDITIDPQFLLPFGYEFADGVKGTSGLGDMMVLLTFWFLNDPASRQYFGLTPYLFVPTGNYDSNADINLGANRWGGRLEACYVKGWGNWQLDLGGNVEAYTNNNRYKDNQTLKQDPTYTLEAHVTYDITKNMYMGLEYFYTGGGKKKVDDVTMVEDIQSQAIQVCSGIWFSPQYQLLAQYRLGLDEKNGLKANILQFRFLYVF